jgi:hypothetical protein
VSLPLIESALRLRYPFGDHYNFNKAMLSKSLGKLHPKIDSLKDPNALGVYRCKMSGGSFFTIQDPIHAPPEMPTTYANNSEWIKLCQKDEQLLASYKGKVNREKTYDRHANKKQKVLDEVFDDVDIFLADKRSTHNTTICTSMSRPPPQMAEEWRKLDYWDSGEAVLLFNPIPGKSVKQCLCERERLLQDIIDDVRKVTTVNEDGDADKTPLNARQQQRLVTQCLYLPKAYENAIQYMNAWTWHKCCEEAIESIRDLGISYICNEKTILHWHIFF